MHIVATSLEYTLFYGKLENWKSVKVGSHKKKLHNWRKFNLSGVVKTKSRYILYLKTKKSL